MVGATGIKTSWQFWQREKRNAGPVKHHSQEIHCFYVHKFSENCISARTVYCCILFCIKQVQGQCQSKTFTGEFLLPVRVLMLFQALSWKTFFKSYSFVSKTLNTEYLVSAVIKITNINNCLSKISAFAFKNFGYTIGALQDYQLILELVWFGLWLCWNQHCAHELFTRSDCMSFQTC